MKTLVKIGVRNEKETFPGVLAQVRKCQAGAGFDILLVDDGSTDGTERIIAKSGLLFIRHEESLGISRGHRAGMDYALTHGYDCLVTLDGDGQHAPNHLFQMLDTLQSGIEFVQCSRYATEAEYRRAPLDRRLLQDAVIGMLHRYVDWEPLTDALCGFWGLRCSVIERVLPDLKVEGYGFQIELLLRLWNLSPRPRRVELAHPAIYGNGTDRLDALYTDERVKERMRRFSIHARHVWETVRALQLG